MIWKTFKDGVDGNELLDSEIYPCCEKNKIFANFKCTFVKYFKIEILIFMKEFMIKN